MYAQLGNIIFDNLNGWDSFTKNDDTTYAKHDLISGKPRLQPIANELEEISLSIHLRAEFVNIEGSISALKTSKDKFEILPLVMGNGRYLGDYVIINIGETHNQAFADGQLIDATLSLTLQEYSTTDKLSQQQTAARKAAFAVGDKKPVLTGLTQPPTLAQTTVQQESVINSEAKNIDQNVIDYANNPSQQGAIADAIEASLNTINTVLDSYRNNTQALAAFFDANSLDEVVQALSDAANGFSFPVPSLASLQGSNLLLQSTLSTFKSVNTTLNYNVIIRRL
jgi:phage protein U